jgi:L-amino acid N-acyltransferase YncA
MKMREIMRIVEGGIFPKTIQDAYVVWRDDTIRVAVDRLDAARVVTAWDDSEDSYIGILSTANENPRGYLQVVDALIKQEKYRGRGIGAQMYRALLTHLSSDLSGISSYLPNRYNHAEVPAILQKLGGRIEGKFELVDRPS